MKIIQNFLTVATCVFLMMACSKEGSVEQGSGGGNSAGRAKTYTETLIVQGDTDSYTYNLSYDNAGRLIEMALATDPTQKFTYGFPSATLFTADLYAGSANPEIHTDYFLNARSYIDSGFQYNNTNDSSATKFIYNSNDQLITQKEYDYEAGVALLTETITYTYNGEGQVSKETYADGTETNYTYFADVRHPAPFVIGPFNDRSNASWFVEKSRTVYQNGALIGSAEHTYTFDDKNRVLTDRAEISDGSVAIKKYTY